MNCIELKIKALETSENDSIKAFKKSFNAWTQKPDTGELTATTSTMLKIKKFLSSECHTCRDGISGGCYGARDGKQYAGLTVWVDATKVTDRYIDSEGDEIINIIALLNEHGTLVEGLDGDTFTESCESLGLSVKPDNTCNYMGQNSEDPCFMFDAQFDWIENENSDDSSVFISIMFHCGGDVRGNYSEKVVYKFNYSDDAYNVLSPTKMLTDDDD